MNFDINNVKIAVIGLGYVGLPLAISFSKKFHIVGFDIDSAKVNLYKNKIDKTGEISSKEIEDSNIEFTDEETRIKETSFIIITVPTPVDKNKNPDFNYIKHASKIVARNIIKNSIIVYESTVYPGATEEICIPILEKFSGMKCGNDFKVGYSPERINPGDKTHNFTNIKKIVSAIDDDSLKIISKIYSSVILEGVYEVSSIKVAEAAKVIENTQRDINIAFINELSKIFHKMNIDTLEVLEAASTKWNFLNFRPGLVGGHCISVDPYYLAFKSQELGYYPEVILSGRRINDSIGKYIAENTIKFLVKNNLKVSEASVLIMGVSFKENVSDIRNSKVIDIINELKEYKINVFIEDPIVNADDLFKEYGLKLSKSINISKFDAIILSVPHKEYLSITLDSLKERLNKNSCVLIDVKGVFNKQEAVDKGLTYWRL